MKFLEVAQNEHVSRSGCTVLHGYANGRCACLCFANRLGSPAVPMADAASLAAPLAASPAL